ncbi:MAG: glycosyltransferase [Patescibacteria group bacterium]|nr:glycosyltransferase [Patescibacteria group bacterium]
MPSITLVTSLYRSEKYLEKFIEYLHRCEKRLVDLAPQIQYEFLIVSNDASEKERKILAETDIQKLRTIFVPRESLYASWNRGVREASGDVIAFWNVDDVRFADAIIDGMRLLADGNDLVYFLFRYKRFVRFCGIDILIKNTVIKPPVFDRDRFAREMHCGPFFMFTKSFFKRVGAFDESFKIAGDFDWCARAARMGTCIRSEKVAGIFTNSGTSLSGSKNPLQQEENDRIYQKNRMLDKIPS